MNEAIILVGLLALAAWGILETICLAFSKPTISSRVQRFVKANPQIAVLAGVIVGWLIAHLTGAPG